MLEMTAALRDLGLQYPHRTIPTPFRFESPVLFGREALLYPDVEIGAHSYMNGGYLRERTKIGRFCSIAYYVTVGIGSHDIDLLSTHPWTAGTKRDLEHQSPFYVKNDWRELTTVGDDVWIGQGATVLKGVEIGTGAVVAAGSVVNKNVPPYAIVGGVPAKIIRYRFDKDTIENLLASEWWMLPIEFLRTLRPNNIFECLEKIRDTDTPRQPRIFIEL